MAKTTPPDAERQAPDEQPAAAPEAPPGPRFWRYSGPERTYTHIPVTVRDGDVVEYTADVKVIDGMSLDSITFNKLVAEVEGTITASHTEPAPPAFDGCWVPCDGPATVHPDNHSTTDSAGA
jgi:hypothetical protein